MPVPTHRPGCTTELWRTLCPDCDEPVVFFKCSCGSKVFFDRAGEPWPKHEERCLRYLIRVLREVHHMSADAIRQLVERYAQERRLAVPPDVSRLLQGASNRESGATTVFEILPSTEPTGVIGAVTAVNDINFLRRVPGSDTAIGRALLGKLIQDAHQEVQVRTPRDESTGFVEQVTFVVPLATWTSLGVRKGSNVAVDVSAVSLPGGRQIWVARHVVAVGRRS